MHMKSSSSGEGPEKERVKMASSKPLSSSITGRNKEVSSNTSLHSNARSKPQSRTQTTQSPRDSQNNSSIKKSPSTGMEGTKIPTKENRTNLNNAVVIKKCLEGNAVGNYDLCTVETILESNTIAEATRHMAVKNLDFVLVLDVSGRLKGILTDKDLAFRVVAEGLDTKKVTVDKVMTRDPQCVQSTMDIVEALNKMVINHFRHLPVMEAGGEKLVGVLDIAQCLFEALQKVELADAAASEVASAMKKVEQIRGIEALDIIKKNDILAFADRIREILESPKVSLMMAAQSDIQHVTVDGKCTVFQAVCKMKRSNVTAILIQDDENSKPLGIFTSKDILLRVVAAGLDPSTTTIIRVMTPNPDVISGEETILSALRQMHIGHYLHLPIFNAANKQTVGILDVLQLTYRVLEQLGNINGNNNNPLWHQLWSPPPNAIIKSDLTSTNYILNEQTAQQRQPPLRPLSRLSRPRSSDPMRNDDAAVAGKDYDDFTSLPSSAIFLIRYGTDAMLLTVPSIFKLPKLKDLLSEAAKKFRLKDCQLSLIDEYGDLISVKDDKDLDRLVLMVTSTGNDQIIFILKGIPLPWTSSHFWRDRTSEEAISLVLGGITVAAIGLMVCSTYWQRIYRI